MRALLLLLLLTSTTASDTRDVTLHATAVPLDPQNPDRMTVGQLRYRAGFHLTADAEEFGGFSGLVVHSDGRLLAISDRGYWLEAELRLNAEGNLEGVRPGGRMGQLQDLDGQPVEGKHRSDAEELVELPGQGYLVSFERDHRLMLYPETNNGSALAVRPRTFAFPEEISRSDENKGMEALVRLRDGRLLTFAEKSHNGIFPGWLHRPRGRWKSLSLSAVEDFEPTGAALLPTGDVLVLERSYSEALGFNRARLVRIERRELKRGAKLAGSELARIEPPMTVDNMEAVAVAGGPRGEVFVYVLSDDNLSAKQRTLLMQFVLRSSR